jgi:uncharacterized protein
MDILQDTAPTTLPPSCKLIVVKVAERCNLNCTYCYMFNGGDRSFLKKPPLMSTKVVDAMMMRVRKHCDEHGIKEFAFILHGGEPLLASKDFYRYFVNAATSILGSGIKPRFALQTNGTLLNDDWCAVLFELGIGISFSLDGPQETNDLFRIDRGGRGSFDRVLKGWECAVRNGLKPGLLMVINLDSDPTRVYELVKSLRPNTIDFLLPDATHDKLPPKYVNGGPAVQGYARWLLEVFKLWIADGGSGVKIRLFIQIMRSLYGIKNEGYDVVGTGSVKVLVVESDGEIQPLDGLRFCEEGIVSTELNVLNNELNDAYDLPLIKHYHDSHENLCSECTSCAIKEVCGGGFLAHRYSRLSGFDNPSVYCADMQLLIKELHSWFSSNLPFELQQNLVVPVIGGETYPVRIPQSSRPQEAASL